MIIKLFKYQIINIEIFPFGGYTLINKKINTNINKDILIALGGIINQILLYIIAYILRNYISIITYNLIIKYNLIILIFNMLPIIPLDGNKIIHLLLEKICSFNLAYQLNYLISIISLILFIIFNYVYNLDNYFIIFFLLFKLILDIFNYKYIKQRFLLERCLEEFPFYHINNHTKSINSLQKEVYHYFKYNNKYINEKDVIWNSFYKSSNK